MLAEPKNAIVRQYQKLLAMDEVKLEFEEGALYAIAAKAKESGGKGASGYPGRVYVRYYV